MNHSLYIQHKAFLRSSEKTFVASTGNYYSFIQLPEQPEHKRKYFFRKPMPKTVFCVGAELQKELTPRLSEINEHCGDLQESQVKYFEIGNLNKPLEKVCMIDINSAYATTLYNFDLITERMYERLLSVKKEYRLPAVGLMASKSMLEYYERGKLKDYKTFIKNPALRKLFLRLCVEVSICMDFIAMEMKEDFIFSWVDGVIINNFTPDKFFKVQEIMRSFYYDFKTDFITVENIGVAGKRFYLDYTGNKGLKQYSVGLA